MLFFSWQAQHFEHVMAQNWALVCSIVTWCSRKKNINIFSLNRQHHVMIEGFGVAVAIFDRNVVSRCGAGCVLKPGVRARVCAVAILNRNVVFRCGAGCILKLGVCVWRGGHFGQECFVVVRAAFLGWCARVCVVR